MRMSHDHVRGARGAGHWQPRFYDFNVYSHKKKKGKTGVHARESGGARAREAPEGLALEQFLFLRQKRSRIGGDRCSGFVETPNQAEPMKKTRPPKPRTGHPKSTNDLRPGHPPRVGVALIFDRQKRTVELRLRLRKPRKLRCANLLFAESCRPTRELPLALGSCRFP